jgi:uncharacterized protein (TIGR00730 family)
MKESKGFYKETKKEEFRVTVFGSARIKKTDKIYQEVFELGKMLGERGMDVVNGGGPGLMNAVSAGHKIGKNGTNAQTIGLNIKLPHEQKINKNVTLIKEFARFSKRLDNFMLLSDAVIVCPGGLGTLLELFYTWQLIQVEGINNIPVILMGDMWDGLIEWTEKQPLKRNYLDKKDLQSLFIAKNAKEALEIIDKAYEAYKKKDKSFCLNYKKYKLE